MKWSTIIWIAIILIIVASTQGSNAAFEKAFFFAVVIAGFMIIRTIIKMFRNN